MRGWLARREVEGLREIRSNTVRLALQPIWDILVRDVEEFATSLFRRIYAISPQTAALFPFSKDESVKCIVSTAQGEMLFIA